MSAQAQVKVFLLAGQSNAVGYAGNAADLPENLREPFEEVLFWYDIGSPGARPPDDRHVRPSEGTSVWVPLRPQAEFDGRVAFDKPGAGFTGQSITTGHGVELTLGRELAGRQSDKVAILKFGWAGTPLASAPGGLDWNPNSPDEYYDWLVQETATALNRLETDLGTSGSVAGLFWLQGESDAYPGQSEAYEENLQSFLDAVRDERGEALPVVIGQTHQEIVGWSHPFIPRIQPTDLAEIRAAQNHVAAKSPFTGIADVDDIPLASDSLHFDSSGLQVAGRRLADAYFAIVPQPPLLSGDYNGNGRVEQADLDLVLLNWGSELLNPAAVGWLDDLPNSAIDQEELDKVLLHWGSGAAVTAAAVPEPSSLLLVGLGLVSVFILRITNWRRVAR